MRAIAISLALHGAVAIALATCAHPRSLPAVPRADPAPIEVTMIVDALPSRELAPKRGGGGGTPSRGRTQIASRRSALDDVSIGRDDPGTGGGTGGGHGRGIGFGDGDGIAAVPTDVPAPPQPVVSHERPARLLVPMRQQDVDDDELFVARVTIDEAGDVAGVHMVRTHPGRRGEIAESAIWTFHYDPARDAAGKAVRATFEQPFAIR